MQNIPDDIRIPTPPAGCWSPRRRPRLSPRLSLWQEAAAAGIVGLLFSWSAAELTLLFNGF